MAYGHYWYESKPVLTIASGDIIDVEITSIDEASQTIGVETHCPPTQASAVQASPSVQGAVFGTCTHPVAGSHESSVHGL